MAYVDIDNQSGEDIEEFKRSSMSGESGRRTGGKKIKMPLKVYKARQKLLALLVATATAAAVFGGSEVIETASNNWTVNKLMTEFHTTYVSPETHRTYDNQHHFYDYDDIAKHLYEYGDFDEAVYLLNKDIGYYQTGLVLKWTPYGSFTNYLAEKGYKDEEEFQEDMKKQVILGFEIDEMNAELLQLQASHTSEHDVKFGGK